MMFSCTWYHSFSLLHLERKTVGAVNNVPISGSRWRVQECVHGGLHKQHVSQSRFPPGEKVAAGGGAIKQHISPNTQHTKQT